MRYVVLDDMRPEHIDALAPRTRIIRVMEGGRRVYVGTVRSWVVLDEVVLLELWEDE